jgi:hypothetical protein
MKFGIQEPLSRLSSHIDLHHRDSTGASELVLAIGFNSAPPPLSALFLPVNEKWWLDAGRSSSFSFAWLLSPNREKMLRFFGCWGFASSFNPTSSKPSSGSTWSWLEVEGRGCCIEERGVARERRTSRERLVSTEWRTSSDWRGYVSWTLSWMGERAEMSCVC